MKKARIYFILMLTIILGFFSGLTFVLKTTQTISFRTIFNYYIVIGLVLWFFLSIIIHELGHLVFGLITKFRFLSFQVGPLLIKKSKGKIYIKKIMNNGLAGQCLMAPPKGEKKPFIWYNLGGIIFNLLFFLSLYFSILIYKIPLFWFSLIYSGSFVNFFLAIINAVPIRGALNNDGLNMLNFIRNPNDIKEIYQNLEIASQLINDNLYQELILPEPEEEINYRNAFEVFIEIIRVMKLESSSQKDDALILLRKLYGYRFRIIDQYRYLVEMMLFCALVLNDNIDEAKVIYNQIDEKIKKVLSKIKYDWGLFTYLLYLFFIEENKGKARFILDKTLEKRIRTSYLADEIRISTMLKTIDDKMKGKTNDNISL